MGGETHKSTPNNAYPKLAARPVGQKITSIYTDRLHQFTDRGQYAGDGLFSKMDEGRASGDPHVKLWVYSVPHLKRPSFDDAMKGHFNPTKTGVSFGPSWSTHWFKVAVKIPHSLRDKRRLEFHWDGDNEGMIWSAQGVPLQGLTGGGERVEWILPDSFRDGKEHIFYVEMACNGMFGNAAGDVIQPPKPDRFFNLHTADIVAVNLDARQLYYDFWIIGDAAREFPGDSWEKHKALTVGNQIIDAFIAANGSQESILKGREIAQEYLGENVSSPKVYLSDKEAIIYAIGHCHIDTCWLWPWDETKRKVARSWSNQCDLMDRYPEHRFACSQAQQYKWLKQYYPAVFERVKEKVAKGQFQPIGGSWVEHDTNMPSGESLVRQFLYGQRYFEAAFGKRSQTFWLPDTFGYSTQIPQICRLAGMSRFFTQKLSWNNINNFPHTTFNWVSLDGSQVLCHMAPAETYTADAHFGDVNRSLTQHKSLDQDNTSLLVFGKGDGGGGPTFEHLEKLRRCRGLSDKTGRLPRVQMGKSVDDFFDELEKKALSGKVEYTNWYGELYLELHRGTYTTQANNKWNNRKTEILMHDIEEVATLASLKSKSYKYPKKHIDDMWEGILLCQFHDCLPGSAIEMCYDDSDKVYEEVWSKGDKLLKEAFHVLGYRIWEENASPSYDLQSEDRLIAMNLLPWTRHEVVDIPCSSGQISCPFSSVSSGEASPMLQDQGGVTVQEKRTGVFVLENKQFQVYVEQGAITSLYDKQADRQVLAKGAKGNQLVVFDDKPLYWQAWDVEVFHLESRKELSPGKTELGRSSNHKVSVVTRTKISENSWVKSTISLSSTSDEWVAPIVVENEVEWRENKKFLKVEFPVDIVNTEASYETQYGIIRRPTHYNTSWDMAKFEVCCHKWADLSEANYGVSILNDSKYGFATCGNKMTLSLLRAPKAPDAHADMGRHYFKYAIFPHQGPLNARTVRAAYNFNHPMRLVTPIKGTTNAGRERLNLWGELGLDGDKSLIMDAIKRGEDDEDVSRGDLPVRKGRSIIVRIHESLGGKSRGAIGWNPEMLKVKKVFSTNALEDDENELDMSKSSVKIELRAFEVATFRLQL